MSLGHPLSDTQIRDRLLSDAQAEQLIITPITSDKQFGSVSVDLRLGTRWQVLKTSLFQSLDPRRQREETQHLLYTSSDEFRVTAGQAEGLVLHPGALMLALSLEYLQLPPNLTGQLDGRSTWARVGLQVHATAGMIDPGFAGYLTFELQNMGGVPLTLFPGLRVAQISFYTVSELAQPYNQKGDAAYSFQHSVQSKFTDQPEHAAMAEYLKEQLKRRGKSGDQG